MVKYIPLYAETCIKKKKIYPPKA